MSAQVLLNLLNELGKSDKMRGLLTISLLFRNEFNKFNNTGARMLDSIWASLRENLSSCCQTKRVSNQSPQLKRLAKK